MNNESRNKRRSRRVKFVYPITLKIFSKGASSRVLMCFFKSISMNGATIQGKDQYGLVDPTTIINARVKIELNIFQKEKVFLFARVRSVIEADLEQDSSYLIGVEFEELEEWQEEIINRIFDLRDKEHKMIWNLLDRNQEEVPG